LYQLLHDATGKTPSTVRISLGVASNFADVYRFMAFAASFRDRLAAEVLTDESAPYERVATPDAA
jgi:hypothetical protein